ncbi:MAG: hypothetical protein J3R72DRAFT_433140 [Linnemannia gamsii]|nr:MAG: hypothetical protein J3R72DRAFT_433140 [Linnemannia gamsii]
MGGLFLHKKVAAVIVDRYQYDQKLNVKGNPYIAVLVTGFFKCYNCKPKKHQPKKLRIWRSDAICVEIWMLSSGHEYRTRLHFQICEDCNTFVKPEVIEDDYVTMVVTELDRWTGQSSEVKPRQKYFKTGLHRKAKCGACLKGVCPLKPAK